VTGNGDIEIVDFQPAHTEEIVRIWRAGFEDGVGIVDPNPIEGQQQYFLTEIVPLNHVRVALRDHEVVGFVAATPESVSQLHVRMDLHRRGLGTRLLDWAKDQSVGSLWLYTFVRNTRACAFYEHHGFTAVEYGFEEQWQLDDVRFEWTRSDERAHAPTISAP